MFVLSSAMKEYFCVPLQLQTQLRFPRLRIQINDRTRIISFAAVAFARQMKRKWQSSSAAAAVEPLCDGPMGADMITHRRRLYAI